MSEPGPARVLCVDDEPNLLAGLQRTLFDQFEVVVAEGGEAGLEAISQGPPFAAIISDMRMPGMDGARFLALARERSPDSVRILLTGQADAASAIAAVNQGAIFRFLCKPCPSEALIGTLEEAVRLHRAALIERELLETTLAGTARMLIEVLSMVAPWASQRTHLIQACVRHVVEKQGWPLRWKVEVAAALSQIGCIGVPGDVVQREIAGDALSEEEQGMFERHPEMAQRLLAGIPRMHEVAEIVRCQSLPPPPDAAPDVQQGAQLLRTALQVTRRLQREQALAQVLSAVRQLQPPVPVEYLDALADLRLTHRSAIRQVKVRDLVPGWRLEQDVVSRRGMMLLAQGSELSLASILSLRNMQEAGAIVEPILISHLEDAAASAHALSFH